MITVFNLNNFKAHQLNYDLKIHLGKNKIVDLLLKNGANVNQVDNSGQTALHRAANKRNFQLFEFRTRAVVIKSIFEICFFR